jgi:hypothetical protein
LDHTASGAGRPPLDRGCSVVAVPAVRRSSGGPVDLYADATAEPAQWRRSSAGRARTRELRVKQIRGKAQRRGFPFARVTSI